MKNLYILFICLFSLSLSQVNAQNTSDCMCSEEYDPVCASDGSTYANFCFATCENADIVFEGACEGQVMSFTANVGELFTYFQTLGANSIASDGPYWEVSETPEWAVATISTDWDENSITGTFTITIEGTPTLNDLGINVIVVNQINSWTETVSSSQEIIITVIENNECICVALYDPVCGEDGQTYGNSCEAGCEDVDILYEGECEEIRPCLGDFDIIEQEYIVGFAGMMLHLQVQNGGNDLSTTMASVILANTCASNDQFTFDTWASGDIVDMYFNYSCMSMMPYIEPFEAVLVLSGTTNCAQDISFVFDPQGNNATGCNDSVGIFYNEGSSWNIDDCTFCSCFNGEILCAIAGCAMPPCEDPIYIDGQCCPICEEEIFGCTNPQAINYNPEANIDDESCELDPNSTSCSYYGETLQLGETMTVNGELCACQALIINEWEYNGGAQMFCVPLTDTLGCSTNTGDFYPLGAFMEGECEICQCVDQGIIANNPYWVCEEIADCGGCAQIDCEPGFYCENGECYPETDLMGCTADNGELYLIGSVLEGECETCLCEASILTVFPAPTPSWNCIEIADCGDCSQMDCEPGFYCENGECFPEIDLMGCTSDNGEVYPIGSVLDGECETCFCMPSIATSPLEGGEWFCEEIEDCEDCECPLDVWDPVCGENGETYSYSCFAECLDLEYEMGECNTVPDTTCICPQNYNPVCGSEGITYSNGCFAECEGLDFYEGECLPTSFCELLEVETETMYLDNGEVQLNITIYNNSTNDINYPVFSLETANNYVSIEPLFENAYWLGAGESTTNSYTLTGGGNAAVFVEGTYYVSQLNQNAACAYPISFTYEPIWGGIGCYANGVVYPMGSTLTSDCETCYCPEIGDATVIPTWECADIENCGTEDLCDLIDCADGYVCVNGDCISIEPQEYGCTEGDQWYEFSSVIDQECNTCTCMPGFNPNAEGFWMCTMMPCEEEYGCELEGELYDFGSSIEQGCNMCYCEAGFNPNENGIWSCTEMACGGCTDPEALNYDVFADSDDGTCEYETGTTPNWDSPNTGSNHTLVLAENMLVELDGASLEAGDWIGVFYPLNGELVCAGYTVWDGGTTVIPAQGDDTTTEIQDGFNANQEFEWLVWDASANTTYTMDASYDTSMPNQELYTTNGISTILTLTAQPIIGEQELQLVEGWNLFSTYMVAEVMDVEELFAAFVEDVVIVKNYLGLAYLPEYNFNGVGDLLPGQGYQAKLINVNNLTIEGDYLTPEENPIDLVNGWNLVAYLRTEPADVIAVFEGIQELVIVKDNSGMAYLPEYGFNGIGDMVAGQAYQVKVLAAQQLQYIDNSQSYRLEIAVVENNLQHYKIPINTGSNMSLVIEGNQLEGLLDFGDEIALYSNSNRLVGAFMYQDETIVIPVYGNDDYSKEQDGLLKNEALSLKYWSVDKGAEIGLNTRWESSTGLFEQNSIQVAYVENTNSEFSKMEFKITPNPASHSAALSFELTESSKVEIQVFNILGDLLFNLDTQEYNKGENSINLNVKNYSVGAYIIKLQTSNSVYTKRLLVQ